MKGLAITGGTWIVLAFLTTMDGFRMAMQWGLLLLIVATVCGGIIYFISEHLTGEYHDQRD